jgi:channel protein (hemolysin III family)
MNPIEVYGIPGFREPWSSFSHLLAIPVFAVVGVYLVSQAPRRLSYRVSLSVLVVSTLFLLAMSGVYHMLAPGLGRSVMRQLDVAAVFALIAATATPIQTIMFRGIHRWLPLIAIWSIAITGITLRTALPQYFTDSVGNGVFLALGWGGAIYMGKLWRRCGANFIAPLLWGGIAYTVGVVILTLRWPGTLLGVVGPHELWHVAVLIGLALHWKFIWRVATLHDSADSQLQDSGDGPWPAVAQAS